MLLKKQIKTYDTHLVRIDDKEQMLLETTRDLKVNKAYEGVDWESVKEKYEKIQKYLCQIYLQKMKCFNIQQEFLQETTLIER